MSNKDLDQQEKDRRRKWFRDRAESARIAKMGSRLATSRMELDALWEFGVRALLDAEEELSGRALPQVQSSVQDALAVVLELKQRGTQLQLPLDSA